MKLMYITNDPEIAGIALQAGVDILFVDMEYIGKDIRQNGMDTVKNHHTIDDVKAMRKVIDACGEKRELLVRVNPIHKDSEKEINEAIQSGADIVMLPMWKTVWEVKEFIRIADKRVKTCLLLETKEAAEIIDDVLKADGIDCVYIGLNDLHLSYGMRFMFQPLADGVVDTLAKKITDRNIDFGFGGIAKLGEGMIPAEKVLAEHTRLKSKMVILSRTFCRPDGIKSLDEIKEEFSVGVKQIREEKERLKTVDASFLADNHREIQSIVNEIIKGKEM